jgi:hypothetical protein
MDQSPEFFIDRSLGSEASCRDAARSRLHRPHDGAVYGEDVAQQLVDETWLRDAGEKGWVVLMKDDSIRRRPAERDALADAGVRAFCLTNAQLRKEEQTERFVGNIDRILRQAQQPGPYIYGVYSGYIQRLWPA